MTRRISSIPGLDQLVSLSEKELQRRIVEPLLSALGFSHVRDTSGPTEKGKDLIAIMNDSLGNPELYAIQLKKFRITGKAQAATSLGGLLIQLRQALTEPVIDPLTNVKRAPDKLIFITPYEIPTTARDAFHEQSREPILKALRLLDGRRILELLRDNLPDALSQFSMETQYRLRVARSTNVIPESAIAFQLRHELKLDEIWVEISLGPGDRSLHIIAYEPLGSTDKRLEAHTTRDQVQFTIDRFKDWAGYFTAEDAIVGKIAKNKSPAAPLTETGKVWVDIDRLLTTPRATVQGFLKDVLRLGDEGTDAGAIIGRGIEILSGVNRLKEAKLVKDAWFALGMRDQNRGDATSTTIPASSLLKSGHCIYIIGPAGSGKTTLLRRLTRITAENDPKRVPLFVPLVDIKGPTVGYLKRGCAVELAKLDYQFHNKSPEQTFTELLQSGRLVLFLDGLDETGSNTGAYLQVIDKFAEQHPTVKIILSCRNSFGVHHWHRAFTVSLEPFSNSQLTAFVGRWFTSQPSHRTRLENWLRRNTSMREAARTPLIAATLCSLVEVGEGMPATEYELYENRFDLLLGRWETAKGIMPLSRSIRERYIHYLRALGFHLHSNETRECGMEVALALAERYYLRGFHQTPDAMVRDCIQRSVLFKEPSGGLSFGHLTYQEFLAGIWLASQNPTRFILARITDAWWSKSLEFYSAKRKEIDQLLKIALEYELDKTVKTAFTSLLEIARMSSKELSAKVMSATSANRRPIEYLKRETTPRVL